MTKLPGEQRDDVTFLIDLFALVFIAAWAMAIALVLLVILVSP